MQMRYSDIAKVYETLRADIEATPVWFEATVRDMLYNQLRAQAKIYCMQCSRYLMQLDAQHGDHVLLLTSPEALLNLTLQAGQRNLRAGDLEMALDCMVSLRDLLQGHCMRIEDALEKFDAMPVIRLAA